MNILKEKGELKLLNLPLVETFLIILSAYAVYLYFGPVTLKKE